MTETPPIRKKASRKSEAPRKRKPKVEPKPPQSAPVPLELQDPEGRLDVLAARMIDHAVTRSTDFPLRAIYSRFKPALQECLRQHLGPIDLSAFGAGGRRGA